MAQREQSSGESVSFPVMDEDLKKPLLFALCFSLLYLCFILDGNQQNVQGQFKRQKPVLGQVESPGWFLSPTEAGIFNLEFSFCRNVPVPQTLNHELPGAK